MFTRPLFTRRAALATLAATTLSAPRAFAQDDEIAVQEMRLGNELAKATVTEYASFTCPHCATFHKNTFPALKENYIDTGKINFVYREVYFDRYGLWASMMARCEPAKYFGIVDMLYARQSEWSRAGSSVDIIAAMRKIGLVAGLTNEQMDICLKDQKMAEALVAWFKKNSTADEITSTPTLLVNGTKHSNMSYTDLAAIIDKQLDS